MGRKSFAVFPKAFTLNRLNLTMTNSQDEQPMYRFPFGVSTDDFLGFVWERDLLAMKT